MSDWLTQPPTLAKYVGNRGVPRHPVSSDSDKS